MGKRIAKKDKELVERKDGSVVIPETVSKKETVLRKLLKHEGIFLSVEMGGMSVTVPVPIDAVRKAVDLVGLSNRTVLQVGEFKIGIDAMGVKNDR